MKKFTWLLYAQFFLNITIVYNLAHAEIIYEDHTDFFSDIYDVADTLEQMPIKSIPQNTEFKAKPIKDTTFALFMAADNDLERYAIRNIKQMSTIGSTDAINIVAHLDIKAKNKKICSHFYVEKNNILEFDTGTSRMDSGDPQALINFMKWVVEKFPARHYVLDFWDHGTGIVDPVGNRIIRATDLFVYNPDTSKLELDRSIDFLELILNLDEHQGLHMLRGICWDDTTGHYLTNQKLAYALSIIKNDVMHGQKFDLIGFDACLMSMIEVADIVKDYAHILVASQEVELGTGWNYQNIFAPFTQESLDPLAMAKHMVQVYEKIYSPHTNDYTLSAINLDRINELTNNTNTVAELLVACLKLQKNTSVKKAIGQSRSRKSCTHFDTPQYIDLHHFYCNLQKNLKTCIFTNKQEGDRLINTLILKLDEGKKIIEQIVIANVVGKNLAQAKGISIYFPEQRIHNSYGITTFAKNNMWSQFLNQTVPVAY